ncbi:hypothetical protein CC2G_009562 [Coprinopsis cinerea AmutBmut pab1-1]|nr:hypothetical protein CC2G_009562 [Coprinopsis cinerea AmutBmut pab1-1]
MLMEGRIDLRFILMTRLWTFSFECTGGPGVWRTTANVSSGMATGNAWISLYLARGDQVVLCNSMAISKRRTTVDSAVELDITAIKSFLEKDRTLKGHLEIVTR